MSLALESDHVVKQTFKAGEFIFFEGDLDYDFYIVESGEVELFTKRADGQKIDIASAIPGESFGEFAALDRKPRSASAQAKTETTVFKISEQGYEKLLAELPAWASVMLRSFAGRIRRMNNILAQLVSIDRP